MRRAVGGVARGGSAERSGQVTTASRRRSAFVVFLAVGGEKRVDRTQTTATATAAPARRKRVKGKVARVHAARICLGVVWTSQCLVGWLATVA
ncbi:hypothetical protein ZWY2020_027750 [Hordeum vulgare]|nr:hypothetical protein ZWY2020_025342 [Hordeum vulgare]KAI5003100.1 hypothetical protein ZWY2020_027750 [Hordeum vulgare]